MLVSERNNRVDTLAAAAATFALHLYRNTSIAGDSLVLRDTPDSDTSLRLLNDLYHSIQDVVPLIMFPRKLQVMRIPPHAFGDFSHPDIEFGFVTGSRMTDSGPLVYCRYWSPGDTNILRTKANSEATDPKHLLPFIYHDPSYIDEVCESYGI